MDLALEFGTPVAHLRRRLSGRELHDWSRYVRQRGGLPLTRIETLLARIAMSIDIGLCGISGAKLADYLPDLEQAEEERVVDQVETTFAVGGTVIKGNVRRANIVQIESARHA